MLEPAVAERGGHRWLTTCAYVLLVAGCFVAGFLLAPRPGVEQGPSLDVQRIKLPRPQPIGDFTLQDIDAREGAGAYTRDRLLNQWTLMYFGYSHCPDVCRPSLEVLAEVARRVRALSRWTARLEPAFVTVDPARDTVEVLRTYLSGSRAGPIGLRGSEKRIAALARQLGILYLPGDADAAGNYLVDHPATILLIDPDAHLRAGFTPPHDPARIVEQILDIEREFTAGRAS